MTALISKSMKQIDLFPVEFFEFRTDDMDNKKLIELCSKEPFSEHSALSSMDNIHIKSEYNFFFEWVYKCLEELRINRKYDCESIAITSSWCNKYHANSGDMHLPHKHSMSWYSGIYYATDGAPTMFDDPMIQRTSAQLEVGRRDFFPLEPIEAEQGKLILFPGYVFHSTMSHRGPDDRWSIAFNTFPSGKVNYNLGRDSIAILDVRSENS